MTKSQSAFREEAPITDLLQEIRGGSRHEQRVVLRRFDWTKGDLRQLGWMMAQKGLDLGTAMTVFLNGNPERYNYLRKDKVPLDARVRCQVLDSIHRRVISGFYLPDPDRGISDVLVRILEWVERQEDDQTLGRQGRWVFDPNLFTPITLSTIKDELSAEEDARDTPCETAGGKETPTRVDRANFRDGASKPSLLRDLFSPLLR